MSWAMIGAAAIGAISSAKSSKDAKKASKKAQDAETQRQREYLEYLEQLRNEPKRIQPWNPIEYNIAKERMGADSLRRNVEGAKIRGGAEALGTGTMGTSKYGAIKYQPGQTNMMDALKNAGFFEALQANQDYRPPEGLLDVDSRYITEGVKPGEAPDWLVGVKRDPNAPPPKPPGQKPAWPGGGPRNQSPDVQGTGPWMRDDFMPPIPGRPTQVGPVPAPTRPVAPVSTGKHLPPGRWPPTTQVGLVPPPPNTSHLSVYDALRKKMSAPPVPPKTGVR